MRPGSACVLVVVLAGCSSDGWPNRPRSSPPGADVPVMFDIGSTPMPDAPLASGYGGVPTIDEPLVPEDRAAPSADAAVPGDRADASRPPEDTRPGAACFAGAACDPVRNTGCPAGLECGLSGSDRPTCYPAAGGPGWEQPCAADDVCAPGFRCWRFGGRICVRICCLGDDSVCVAERPGTTCTSGIFTSSGACR